MQSSRYQHDDIIDVEAKIPSRVHKEDTRYWTRPVRNCEDIAYAEKQYAAKAPVASSAVSLLKLLSSLFA